MNTFKLKYKDTYIENILPSSTVHEISKKVQKDFTYPIIGAKYNNLFIDLDEVIKENGTIEFLDRSSKEGNSIYERTLEFLIIVSAKEVLKDKTDIHINYSLDSGIYCEVEGQAITNKTVSNIENKMKEIVSDDLPIIKSKVLRTNAIRHFTQTGQMDKVKNLNYTSNSTVDLHKIKNTYDYFFGPLAARTSQIDRFKLTYIDKNMFVVTYPNIRKPEEIPDYVEHKNIIKKYEEVQKWSKIINIKIASDLNSWYAEGKYQDIISLFETHFESELSKVAEDIYKKKNDIKIILIAGPSSSGKTITTKKLSLYLKAKGIKTHQISLDDYLVDRLQTPKDENGDYDYDNIGATDVDLFNRNLTSMLKGEKTEIPNHDFINGKLRYNGNYIKMEKEDILLIEGTHALNDILTKEIERKNKYKIFITPLVYLKIDNHNRIRTTDIRKLRRIVRDSRTRNTTAEQTLKMWSNVDRGTFENIYPYQDDADAVINSSLGYEIGVLRTYAEPLLYGISPNSKVYPEAIRLINLLRQFIPITSEGVPKDSIIREFIGEGIY